MKIFKYKNVDLAQVCFLARKHGFVQFDGSCLNLPEDKFVTVFLTKPIAKIRKVLGSMDQNDSYIEEVEERSEWYNKYNNDDQELMGEGGEQEYYANGYQEELTEERPFYKQNLYNDHFDNSVSESTLTYSPSQRLHVVVTCKPEIDKKINSIKSTSSHRDINNSQTAREGGKYQKPEHCLDKSESGEYFNPSCHGVHVLITCKKGDNLDEQTCLCDECGCSCGRNKPLNSNKRMK